MDTPVIECCDLSYGYDSRLIYEQLSFSVPQGRVLGLLGKNGTGKTTTINLLNGYLEPRSGSCRLFGEDARQLSEATRQRVALLLEGHVQHSYMSVEQLERFHAPFYPHWDREIYYELVRKLHISPGQRIERMSCGQRSQVALGIILAQRADLLILDDFSLGLDPGYRALFIEYLSDYLRLRPEVTVFVTSHIIQDMEHFIDDCIILDYGRILLQRPVGELLDTFHRYSFTHERQGLELQHPEWMHPEERHGRYSLYSFASASELASQLEAAGIQPQELSCERLSLEEAFIGLTGKY